MDLLGEKLKIVRKICRSRVQRSASIQIGFSEYDLTKCILLLSTREKGPSEMSRGWKFRKIITRARHVVHCIRC